MIEEKLHDLVDPDEAGPAPVDDLLRRGRRARVNRVARTAGAGVAAVAMVAGLAAVVRPGEPDPVPLALAAQTTRRTTFHFRQTFWSVTPAGNTIIEAGPPYRGAYDPVHERGYRNHAMPGESKLTHEERQIGDDCYVRSGARGPWYRSSISDGSFACWRLTGSAEGSALGVSASPADLLAELEKAGQVRYAGRTDKHGREVDTYRFTYRFPATVFRGERHTIEKRGTVDIDVATRRIIHLKYTSTDVTGDRGFMITASEELSLSRFGEPVVVKRPDNVVPQ